MQQILTQEIYILRMINWYKHKVFMVLLTYHWKQSKITNQDRTPKFVEKLKKHANINK